VIHDRLGLVDDRRRQVFEAGPRDELAEHDGQRLAFHGNSQDTTVVVVPFDPA